MAITLDSKFKEDIIGMVSIAPPTDERLNQVLAEWQDYFQKLNISEDKQVREFRLIMSARVKCGNISVLAPDISKELQGAIKNGI